MPLTLCSPYLRPASGVCHPLYLEDDVSPESEMRCVFRVGICVFFSGLNKLVENPLDFVIRDLSLLCFYLKWILFKTILFAFFGAE